MQCLFLANFSTMSGPVIVFSQIFSPSSDNMSDSQSFRGASVQNVSKEGELHINFSWKIKS